MIVRTVGAKRSLSQQAPALGLSHSGMRKRFGRELRKWLARSTVPTVPDGPLILLADALWFTFGEAPWTLYLSALKPMTAPVAFLQDPVLLPERECARDWGVAFETLPVEPSARICALVSDGFRGAHTLARRHGWIHQRCHFHLIAQLQARRGSVTRRPNAPVREAIYHATRLALRTPDPARLAQARAQLMTLTARGDCPARLAMIGREFLRHLEAFRAYRNYPELQLPTTTNVLESQARRIRDRVRTINSPRALLRWATAVTRLFPTMVCNGHRFQPD